MDGPPASSGLGKLLPKSMTAKRRRRREKSARNSDPSGQDDDARSTSASSSLTNRGRSRREPTLDSDEPYSAHMHDDDDVSFGSHESGGVERGDNIDGIGRRPASKSAPSRPATLSTHPSLIGYLTTSSPIVQAQHLDPQSHFQSPSQGHDQSPDFEGPDSQSIEQGLRSQDTQSPVLGPFAPAKTVLPTRRGRASAPRIQTDPPHTPPKDGGSAPVIVNTPPTPTDSHEESRTVEASPTVKSPRRAESPKTVTDGSSAASNMNIHRRSRSGSAVLHPSKLSHITTAPLTPTDESSSEIAPSAGGFFSSMLSAAQNAANSITNTIPGTALSIGGNKSRVGIPKSQSSPVSSQTTPANDRELEPEPRIEDTMDRKESAVQTLGSGELSLSQFGLTDAPVTAPPVARLPDVADARTRSESAPAEPQVTVDTLPAEPASRPRSLVDTVSVAGDKTPPQFESPEAKTPVQRSSSLRSAMKPHRKRGSSVTTGGTIATAMAAAHHAALHPSGTMNAPRLTGFAIASKKRNREFHNLFKSVPDDDYLIEDYSCALQREILAHGRLYVSEGHLCFSSNILGWTTTLVMSFDEIVSVEKRSTALVFKNGLMISTLHAKHIFASFTSRDATYDLIVNIWKLGHPTLKSTLNGVQLEGTGGDKTEKIVAEQEMMEEEPQAATGSEDSGDDDEEEFYDEEEHDEPTETQSTDVTAPELDNDKVVMRKASAGAGVNGASSDLPKEIVAAAGGVPDFPGPASHAATDCGDSTTHYDKILGDEIIPAPLGKVYNLVFGPGSVVWMNRWLSSDQKCTDIQMEDKKGLTADNRSRTFTYIKPLNGSIGPRQTKCVVTETMEQIDLDKAVNLGVSTQTPEVPYGNLFTTKTKYCLSWAENNATRMQINCTVEWTGKCWLKGTIEKNVNDGQARYCEELFTSLRSAVSTRARTGTGLSGPVKGKKKLKRSKALQSVHDSEKDKSSKSDASKHNWGALEPLHSIVEPAIDMLRPVLTGHVMFGLLVGLLVAMWFGSGPSPTSSPTYGREGTAYSPGRQAAYEEMWRRQDSELWEWLEERVGMDRLNSDQSSVRRRAMDHRTVEERLREERMDELEMQEAIRVTEEKLRVLREVVQKDSRST